MIKAIDMRMPHSQLRAIDPKALHGVKACFYVRYGMESGYYGGLLFDPTQPGKIAQGNALYKINVRFK